MFVERAVFKNFRNIEEATIKFCDGVNILYGGNAEGKTSALEGIYICSSGRSHRTPHEKEIIKNGKSFAVSEITFFEKERHRDIELYLLKNGKKSCKVSGIPIKKMSEFVGIFKSVIFCPEHLSIIKDGPAERRAFLDRAISSTDKQYLISLQNYNLALLQRNKILSDMMLGQTSMGEMLDIWTEKLSEFAEILSKKREDYIILLNKYVKTVFSDMTGEREIPSLSYIGGYSKQELIEKLKSARQREIRIGNTLFGIHKDDIGIYLSGMPSRSYSSQGQQRSLALALKLSEGEICRDIYGEYPVYLLDDILSELDKKRKEYIISGLSSHFSQNEKKQIIITCTDSSQIEKEIKALKIRVENGMFFTEKS